MTTKSNMNADKPVSSVIKQNEAELTQLFKTFDVGQSGSLDFDEVKNMIRSSNSLLPTSVIKSIFKKLDGVGGDNRITLDEFLTGIKTIPNLEKSLTDAFTKLDTDKLGALTKDKAKEVITSVLPLGDDELNEVLDKHASKNVFSIVDIIMSIF